MLRLFFGQFVQNMIGADWEDLYAGDSIFHMFGWGKKYTDTDGIGPIDFMPSKRVPFYQIGGGMGNAYDEYIDLPSGEIDPSPVELFAPFLNSYGVTTPFPVLPTTFDSGINQIQVEATMNDWLAPTRHVSKPVPHPTNPAAIYVNFVNQTMEANPALATTGYLSFAATWYNGTLEGYANDPVVIPYNNATTDVIRVEFMLPSNLAFGVLRVYRAPVERATVYTKLNTWSGWEAWRLLDQHRRITGTAITATTAGWQTATGTFADTAGFPYATRQTPVSCWCPFLPLNNAIARMGLSWQKRLAKTVMVMNTGNLKYYKGKLSHVSPAFIEGLDAQSENTAQFVLDVTEEGSFDVRGLDDPNTATHFTAITKVETIT